MTGALVVLCLLLAWFGYGWVALGLLALALVLRVGLRLLLWLNGEGWRL